MWNRGRMPSLVDTLRAAGCVFAEEEADLLRAAATSAAELAAMVEDRVAGTPLEQVLGWASFRGHRILLEPGVFVPRRRTELVVTEALRRGRLGSVVADLCCGSGALGVALARELREATVYAVDIDPAAVRTARRNLLPFHAHALQGDLFHPLPEELRGSVDVVVVCAPYVPTEAIPLLPPEARLHEPRSALDGGADGLDVVRRVVAGAPVWLAAGAHVVVETSEDQASSTVAAFSASGMEADVVHDAGLSATVVVGTAS